MDDDQEIVNLIDILIRNEGFQTYHGAKGKMIDLVLQKEDSNVIVEIIN